MIEDAERVARGHRDAGEQQQKQGSLHAGA
jgi:hypothetical protein